MFQRFYIVGSNKLENRFRVLKIDRTEPRDLLICDDKAEYSRVEIRCLLATIDGGNKSKKMGQPDPGLIMATSAFGLVGFVQFLEGPYLMLITKRKKVALIGQHTVYKIEDSAMIYIPNDTVRVVHPDEARYVKMFQNVDLSSNFYFSYSYDLTHSLQYNMADFQHSPDHCLCKDNPSDTGTSLLSTKHDGDGQHWDSNLRGAHLPEIGCIDEPFSSLTASDSHPDHGRNANGEEEGDIVYGVRQMPTRKFIWNKYLLKDVEGKMLKHISKGAVANEVETEQIVQDMSIVCLSDSKASSYVQLRGSIPLYWSQDHSKMVAKPPIILDQRDPYSSVAGHHFNQILMRYGTPVVVLNLVKNHEKRRHENILKEEFVETINNINQFLPPSHAIQYIGFDMAHVTKKKNADVMQRLAQISQHCMKQTGFYLRTYHRQVHRLMSDESMTVLGGRWSDRGCLQSGVVRTNCVDCLDRTNTAQFALGKCALASQLCALGVYDFTHLEFDCDCVKMLERLYENHGDVLALQYGGSHLVHRIKGYRKITPWMSHSRDIMHTLSRYYSNTFSDVEKQQALNVFLGVFRPVEGGPRLWELPTDYYLHNFCTQGLAHKICSSYTQWWDPAVYNCLPLPYIEVEKSMSVQFEVVRVRASNEEVNMTAEFYCLGQLTVLENLYEFFMCNATRKLTPKGESDFSPFSVRILTVEANDRVSSIMMSSVSDETSSTETSSVEAGVHLLESTISLGSEEKMNYISLKDLFPSMKEVYGCEMCEPNKHDSSIYHRCVEVGNGFSPLSVVHNGKHVCHSVERSMQAHRARKVPLGLDIFPISVFKLDSTVCVMPPLVALPSQDIYKTYVDCGLYGPGPPKPMDSVMYLQYTEINN